MTKLIAAGIAERSIGSDVIEHELATSRSIDVKEVEKYIVAADMGLFEIDGIQPVLGVASREIDAARTGSGEIAQAMVAENADVFRFEEAVATLDHAADTRVGYGLGGPDCGPCPDDGGPTVGGYPILGGGGTCPGMNPDFLSALQFEIAQIEAAAAFG